MKRIALLFFAFLALPYFARAQTAQLYYAFTAAATGGVADTSLAPQVDALNVRISGINTTTSWTAQIQTSPDNATWTNCGSAVTATSAASASGGACTPSGAAFTRVLITAGSGGGNVVGALIGTCSLCQVASSGGITLTTTGTSGPATLVGSVLNIPQYSGSSLPTAATGQIITNTSGSTTYAGQANIFYQQSGDTIASIETACSSACTYVVTSPQTITLSASHAMNSNVWFDFESGGKWTVNGSGFTLSNIQMSPATAKTAHFAVAGTGSVAMSVLNTLIPAAWFGSACNGAGNDLATLQFAINSVTNGQVEIYGDCYIAGSLSITKSNVGIIGKPEGRGGYVSGLTETVAGDDAIDYHGTSGNVLGWGVFQNFFINSSVAQSGTASALSVSFVGGASINDVVATDFVRDFYIHAAPSFGGNGWTGDTASWTTLSSGVTGTVGWYLDSADGYAENSLTIKQGATSCLTSGGPSGTIGMELIGTALNDVNTDGFSTANCPYGQVANYTGSGGVIATSDIHFVNSTHDNFVVSAYKITGLTGATSGSLEISGGWAFGGPNTGGTGPAIDCVNSSGITINHVMIGTHSGEPQPAEGVYLEGGSGCTNVTIHGNLFINQPYAVSATNNSAAISVVGNTIQNFYGSTLTPAIQLGGGASNNVLSSNTISGAWTTGISIASGSNNNTYIGNNCGSSVTTCVSDSGTGNGVGLLGNVTGPLNVNGSVFNLTVPGSASDIVRTILQPSLGNGNILYDVTGVAASADNEVNYQFAYTSAGSASNHYGNAFYGQTFNWAIWPNISTEFGETTPAAGPANGIAVGTTGQFQVSGAGAVTAPSYGQTAASSTGGTCAMSTSTICTITLGHTYTTPVCIVTQQSATLTGGAAGCTVSGTTVTITAAVANSETWGALVFGNPS